MSLRFDPRFDAPEPRDRAACEAEALALARFSGRKSFVCDVTGENISPNEAAVLSATEFRQSPLLARVDDGTLPMSYMLVTNWGDWIVKRDLID